MLICEGGDAKRVIQESKKLNMVNGDFVWLWIDTGAMLINDRSLKLEKMKESSFLVEMRKVRHAPNFYANQSKEANASSSNCNKKLLRTRDNNLITSNPLFCNTTNRSNGYENKTDKNLYNNVINTNNDVLPTRNKDASINTLLKHHFPLYRKRNHWNKEEKLKEKIKRSALMNKTPIRLKSTGASKENATLFLSVINGETNHSGLINDNKKEKRVNIASRLPNVSASSSFSAPSKRKRNAKFFDPANATDPGHVQPGIGFGFASSVDGHVLKSVDLVKPKPPSQDDFSVNFEVPVFAEDTSAPMMKNRTVPEMPIGILAVQLMPAKVDKNYVKSSLKLLIGAVKDVIAKYGDAKLSKLLDLPRISCFDFVPVSHDPNSIMEELTK